jgi:DNA polymerase-3 subunit epsilon
MTDAEMAANLMLFMHEVLRQHHGLQDISHEQLCRLQKVPAAKMAEALSKARG